jgi:hypothetical protein
MKTIAQNRNRTLHLIDIENLAGGPLSGDDAGHTLRAYLHAAQWRPGDLVYVAAHPKVLQRFAWDLPVEANLRAAHGPDGADLALLAQCPPEFVARRAQRLVIGSGDHIFIERARAVRSSGVGVAVVARGAESLAPGWRAYGFPVKLLDQALSLAA